MATSKGQIAYFLIAHARNGQISTFDKKSDVTIVFADLDFLPIRYRNFGDSAINMGQIAYFSVRMRETPIILLSVSYTHLTLPTNREV